MPTQPYAKAHVATFPEALPETRAREHVQRAMNNISHYWDLLEVCPCQECGWWLRLQAIRDEMKAKAQDLVGTK